MSDSIRVLHIVSGLEHGGIEKVIENYYTHINRNRVQFDFITHRPEGLVERNIKNLDCNIYHISYRRKHPIKSAFEAYKIMKNSNYKIVHIHGNLEIIPELFMAWIAGIKVRISHSHMSFYKPTKFNYYTNFIARIMIKWLATDYFTCSDKAGFWAYGKKILNNDKYRVLNNAIDLKKFKYNQTIREKTREKLNLENNLVIGNIGRLCFQKNQKFLIKIFNEITKLKKNYLLLIIGRGELEKDLINTVKSYKLENKVKFMGIREDIPELLMGMDAFLLPSRYEGNPVVGIEAQASGLPCVFSSTITKEVAITSNVKFLDLETSPDVWAKNLIEFLEKTERKENVEFINDNYNISKQVSMLEEFYICRSEDK